MIRLMMRGLVLAAALWSTAIAGEKIPYGLYVGNPDGSDAASMARFRADWDASMQDLHRKPQFFGSFTDFSLPWDRWPSNAGWMAWSWVKSQRAQTAKPVIGIKLATNADWNHQTDAFKDIIAGQHDDVYRQVVEKWRDAGFKELRFRISYEFNGNFMPDNFGNTAATLDLWRQAFAHVAQVMHRVQGVKTLIIWNPADINFSSNSVPDAYPGDSNVDIIATDLYNTLYPATLHNWNAAGGLAANATEWMHDAANRIHFWDHPGGTQWFEDGRGWGLLQATNFALQHHKPFAICETGVGGDDKKIGLIDDPVFPDYLHQRLAAFQAKGGVLDHVIIWDFNASDGAWRFTNVPAKAPTAAAWRKFLE